MTSHSWGVWHLPVAKGKMQKMLNSLLILQHAPPAPDGFEESNML